MTQFKTGLTRRTALKTGLAGIIATGVAPTFFTRGAYAQEFCNAPPTSRLLASIRLR